MTTGYENGKSNENEKPDESKKPDETKEQDNLDEFGYEKKPAEGTKPDADKADKEPEKVVEPVAGYDKPPEKPKEVVAEPEKKPEEKKEAAPADEFDVKDPGVLLPEEVNDIKAFVKANKLSKEVGLALVESKKAEIKKSQELLDAHKKNSAEEQKKVRSGWYDELKADSEFGGEKFDFNVKRVDKMIQDFMPNIKKKLTDSKGMLPPYVMKDLAKLSGQLYSTGKLVEGEPSKPSDESKDAPNDPLAFYKS